uniref:Uncharacterized protein n=1 Tax=Fagus sylvatica TaxID=28930 RepID=A0A2N9I6F6_FAGSY
MAANEAEWSLSLSEELPEGLSDESARRVAREVSSKATPSTLSSRQLPKVDRSWKALSFFSKTNQDDIDRIRRRYQIPDDVVLRIPDSDERTYCPKCEGDVAFYEADLRAGLRFPMQPFVREVNSNGEEDLTVDEFLFCYEPCQIALSRGFWTFKNRDAHTKVVQGLPSSDRIWKDKYFFVCGDNWERLPQEDPRDFVGVLPDLSLFDVLAVLDRPLLNSVWQERISRILDIEDRWYTIFIKPDLLATFLLGPVPSSSVKALVKANKKRMDTMKLNKSRLKQLTQSGEVAAAPVNLKRRKVDEGSSKRVEEAPSRPSIPTAIPSVEKVPTVVMVDSDLTSPSDPSVATINQSPHVAMDRAKSAISSRDTDEYVVAHTEDLSYLMVHSLMRGLTEAMVMGRRCASVEEDLSALRAKSMEDEAELKNVRKAVFELTRERKDALDETAKVKEELKARDKPFGLIEAMVMGRRCASVEEDLSTLRAKSMSDEAELKNVRKAVFELTRERKDALDEAAKVKEELKARDKDVEVAVAAKDKAVADLQHLVGQVEGSKAAAAFREQAVQRFPGLDFSALQPYNDDDSVVDVSQDQAGDDDVSSK